MPTPIPTLTLTLVQTIEAVEDAATSFWGLPVAIIISVIVIVWLFRWTTSQQNQYTEFNRKLIERSDKERKQCNEQMTLTIAQFLENQYSLNQIMSVQAEAMKEQAAAMIDQGKAMQEMTATLRGHEKRASRRNEVLMQQINGLTVPLERKP